MIEKRRGLLPNMVEKVVDGYNNTPHSTLSKIFGKPTKPIDVTSAMKKIQDKTEKLHDDVKQRNGYELEPMITVDIERKYAPRKKYDRVSAYEEGEIIGRDKCYYVVRYVSLTYKVPRWQLTQS
jgi:hypothetical protein